MAGDDGNRYSRKGFFGELFSFVRKGVSHHVETKLSKALNAPLRPPGALDEVEFLSTCTRCKECGIACPYGVISVMPLEAGVNAGTPYIDPNTVSCHLCPDMPCIAACEPQALLPVADPRQVRMGRAVIQTEDCMTYDDKVCTLCYDACPYPEEAITIGEDFHPEVLDACVGCGACQNRCPVVPVGVKVLNPLNYRTAVADEETWFGVIAKEEEENRSKTN
ncbi:MAG: 4Fe-4S dicluster domain-containing protein [Acidobacteriota bacterium]|nr:4Fe-4S dicluster domain-containing protein [Acidobacteriota bacterium]